MLTAFLPSSDAPTAKPEYGQYDFPLASIAKLINIFIGSHSLIQITEETISIVFK